MLSIDSRNKSNVLGIDEIEGTQFGFILIADSRNFYLKCENQVDLLKWYVHIIHFFPLAPI
jgi:hypothetical protein